MNRVHTKNKNRQMKRIAFTIIFIFTAAITSFAQVGIGTTAPNSSSVLDLTSANKALLPPRMTTAQRDAIANPVAGMVIYNLTTDCIENYTGTAWVNLCSVTPPLFNGTVITYAPVAVTKTTSQRVFVHLVPWFETPATNSGNWGIHWTMANEKPNIMTNGYRQIATKYYPLTGPYASGDTTIIDYELLLMKLSGVDGVLIDWPGTGTNNGLSNDLPLIERNTRAFTARIAKAGLTYALVYEDQFLSNVANKIAQAQTDMTYAQTHYFTDPSYEQVNSKPLLLVFGPQQLTTGANWASVFSVLTTQPSFFTLWHQSNEASGTTTGEFAWINQDNTTSLNNFYSNSYNPGTKISSAYPGFNSFYTLGGWSGPTWTIAANGTANFQQTLTLTLASSSHYMQLPTWNDYGEGTMIEPTDSTIAFSATQGLSNQGFGFSLLTTLQKNLGVASLAQPDLEAVLQLYKLRQTNAGNATALAKLNQVYYYMVSLQMDKAKALLATF
jgi:hypothetical protein